jgi:hypothetical protein
VPLERWTYEQAGREEFEIRAHTRGNREGRGTSNGTGRPEWKVRATIGRGKGVSVDYCLQGDE